MCISPHVSWACVCMSFSPRGWLVLLSRCLALMRAHIHTYIHTEPHVVLAGRCTQVQVTISDMQTGRQVDVMRVYVCMCMCISVLDRATPPAGRPRPSLSFLPLILGRFYFSDSRRMDLWMDGWHVFFMCVCMLYVCLSFTFVLSLTQGDVDAWMDRHQMGGWVGGLTAVRDTPASIHPPTLSVGLSVCLSVCVSAVSPFSHQTTLLFSSYPLILSFYLPST